VLKLTDLELSSALGVMLGALGSATVSDRIFPALSGFQRLEYGCGRQAPYRVIFLLIVLAIAAGLGCITAR
jgi:hypothetical protein